MSAAQDLFDDTSAVRSDPRRRLAGPELRQRSVRDLVTELAQLEDSARSATASSRVVAGNTVRAHSIVAELRRR